MNQGDTEPAKVYEPAEDPFSEPVPEKAPEPQREDVPA